MILTTIIYFRSSDESSTINATIATTAAIPAAVTPRSPVVFVKARIKLSLHGAIQTVRLRTSAEIRFHIGDAVHEISDTDTGADAADDAALARIE